MTVLKKAKFGTEGEIYGLLFKAPVEKSRSYERNNWKYLGTPFFAPAISRFWMLCCTTPENQTKNILPFEAEVSERANFIKHPIVVLVDRSITDYTARGGIWIEREYAVPDSKGAHFHITTQRDYRRFAYPLLEFFIESLKDRYASFSAAWDARQNEDNPAKFFMNNGFQVLEEPNGDGRAILRLENRTLINRIPIISQIDH